MKTLSITGLMIFLTGFIIFNISTFWASYTLTPNIA